MGRYQHRMCGMSHAISRRAFLEAAAGGAVTASAKGGPAAGSFAWNDATIPELQAAMSSGRLTSRELTLAYLDRMAALNPLLHAVIQANPNAVAIAADLDAERRRGKIRGPMHGIPVLLKDNIATDDTMQTTSGSLALVNSQVPHDAPLVRKLRDDGAVILGKSNLGEWANFRGFNPLGFFGWSARGGATRNPYLLSYTTLGSSSGSAVAAAANLCSVAVGTETDGSIVGPSNANLVVGLKPTLGLISQNGIIPISRNQDTAGPIGRTVTDVAILLGALQTPFGAVAGHQLPGEYAGLLKRGALKGARIGVDRRFFDNYDIYGYPGDADTLPWVLRALDAMSALGATLVDTDTGDYFAYFQDEITALLFEFKVHLAEYLGGLARTNIRTVADVIAFNLSRCPAELVYYGQELLEMSESTSGNLSDPVYVAARALALQAARAGIDTAIANQKLDAIVAPHLTNTSAAAVAGYPNLALPVGITSEGKPAGILLYSTFLREPKLLALAFDLEQELRVRVQPQFRGAISNPPNAGICASLPTTPRVFTGKQHLPRGRFF